MPPRTDGRADPVHAAALPFLLAWWYASEGVATCDAAIRLAQALGYADLISLVAQYPTPAAWGDEEGEDDA